jgi:phospholipid/cholesterol/gamma-HCH transport system substrate-binding protein
MLIGSFMVLFITGMFAFVMWMAKLQLDREFAHYNILFTDSVAGLGLGGDVRFNGIKVGSVRDIAIDPDNPSRVRVMVEIAADTPVRADSYAVLEMQGITGVSYVQIAGGTPTAQMLPRVVRGQLPEIPSRQSKISELFSGAPDLINRSNILVERAADLLNDENRRNISGVIADIRLVSSGIANRDAAIGRVIDAMDRSSADIAEAAKAVRSIAGRIDRLSGDAEITLAGIDGLVRESRGTAVSLKRLIDEVELLVAENRQPLGEFATDGLADIRRFVNEARVLIAGLARVAARLEDDPSQVLFGAKDAVIKPGGK